MKKKKVCGAKTRAGGVCQKLQMPNGRCRYHGGKSTGPPKGSQNNLKHGIYSNGLLKGEDVIFAGIELGTLDYELKMSRLHLMRATKAQKEYLEQATHPPEKDPHGMEVGEVELGGDEKRKVKRRKHDFSEDMRKWTRIVGDLELKRKQLLEDGDMGDGVDWGNIGKVFSKAINDSQLSKTDDKK